VDKARMPHPGHEKHLCHLQTLGFVQDHFAEYRKLVKDGKFVCRACGRVAAEEKSLCLPERL